MMVLMAAFVTRGENFTLLGHVWSVLLEQILQHVRSVLDQRFPGRPIMALACQDPSECFFMIAFSIGSNGVSQARSTRDGSPQNLRRPGFDYERFASPFGRGFRVVPHPVNFVLVTKALDRTQQNRQGQETTHRRSEAFDRR